MAYGMSAHAATPLQAARLELGWKQAQTIHALQEAAAGVRATVATTSSLGTMLSRWENGQPVRDVLYQRLFCEIYCQTPDELGFPAGGIDLPARSRIAPSRPLRS